MKDNNIYFRRDEAGGRAVANELQSMLEATVADGTPGVTAAVATRDGIVWESAAGYADLRGGWRMRPQMLLGIGSITKPFVATLILQLVQERRIRLDCTPASVLGSRVADVANADKASLAQLLNHTSAIPSWEDDALWIREARGDGVDPSRLWRPDEVLAFIKGHPPLDEPGGRYSYSNTNYTLLGMIVEHVSGMAAATAIRRRVCEPLGLQDVYLEGFEAVPSERVPSRYHLANAHFRQQAGVGRYFREVRPELLDVSDSNLSVEWTAGGIMATAHDLALFGLALRQGRLLDSDALQFMTTWHSVAVGSGVGHGLFHSVDCEGHATIGHDGGVLGFTAAFFWVESADVVVAMLCNVGCVHTGERPKMLSRKWRSNFIRTAALFGTGQCRA